MLTENGFPDRKTELEFVLTKMDGRSRNEMLEIKRIHYASHYAAEQWYKALVVEAKECSQQARDNLDKIYRIITGQ